MLDEAPQPNDCGIFSQTSSGAESLRSETTSLTHELTPGVFAKGDKPGTHLVTCSMKAGQVSRVCEMVGLHDEFSGIEIVVDPDLQDKTEGSVTFHIPEGINTVNFFGEFAKTLNERSAVVMSGERVR